jgi:hypothetical protein
MWSTVHWLQYYRTQRPKGLSRLPSCPDQLEKRAEVNMFFTVIEVKGLAIPRVWATMVSCKLQSTTAAFVLYILWCYSPMPSHVRTLCWTLGGMESSQMHYQAAEIMLHKVQSLTLIAWTKQQVDSINHHEPSCGVHSSWEGRDILIVFPLPFHPLSWQPPVTLVGLIHGTGFICFASRDIVWQRRQFLFFIWISLIRSFSFFFSLRCQFHETFAPFCCTMNLEPA